jgi:hypothetical protein
MFDGKLGLWPFIERVAAKRSSTRRAKGTIETKPVNVKKESYLRIDNVLPAIWQKWPNSSARDRSPHIQHDNAPVHFDISNDEWITASRLDGWSIGLKNQCPNSPDTNICDLFTFALLES